MFDMRVTSRCSIPSLAVALVAGLLGACGGGSDDATDAASPGASTGGSSATAGASAAGAGGSTGGTSAAGGGQAGTSAGASGKSGGAGAAGAANGGSSNGGSSAGGTSSGGKGGASSGGKGGASTGGSAGAAAGKGGATSAGGSGTAGGGTAGSGTGGSAGAANQGFTHPGVLDQKGQLDFVKAKIAAGQEPWKSALAKAKGDNLGKLSYKATPFSDVQCGSFSMNPNVGCSEEKDDAAAAYTQALIWAVTGDEAYAKNAIAIMNAWGPVIKKHSASNAPLQAAWAASVWPRAAEIMKYTYTGWAPADIKQFESMFKVAYLPYVENGADSNGNWELSMIEATIGMAVFLDDKAHFDSAVSMWKKRVPAYFYLKSDGALPIAPDKGNYGTQAAIIKYWQGQSTFVDGLCQETCRDLGHTQFGLAATLNAAETALIQGVDLYSLEEKRLTATLEFHANYLDGATIPTWLCGGALMQNTPSPMWEIAYNEYNGRLGASLPISLKVVNKIRPTGYNHMMVWESLSHAQVGTAGL